MKSSLVLLLAPLAALAAPAHEPRQAAESIDELIKAKGKLYYGTCTDQNRLSTGKSADIIKGNFGQVTPENSMKWDVSGPFLFFPFPLFSRDKRGKAIRNDQRYQSEHSVHGLNTDALVAAQAIEPQQGRFSWGTADYLVDFATTNNKTIRGHTLVWHSQLAGWVNNVRDKAQLTSVIEKHVTEVVTRYKGKIRAWVR